MLSEPADGGREVVEFGVETWAARNGDTKVRWVSFLAGASLPTAEAEAIERAAWYNRVTPNAEAVVVKRSVRYGNWEKA